MSLGNTNQGFSGSLFNAPVLTGAVGYYGAFQDTTIQSATDTITAYPLKLGIQDEANGVTVINDSFGNPTKIVVTNAGVYNIQYSLQFVNSDTKDHDANVWLSKNNNNVTDSNSKFTIPSSHAGIDGNLIGAVNYVLSLNAGDFLQIKWNVNNISVSIKPVPAQASNPAIPLSPSAIVTVTSQAGQGIGYYGLTSTTSNSIGIGSKTFTTNIDSSAIAFTVGTRIRVADTAAPTNYMEGIITSFSGTTLVMSSDLYGGSGTYNTWDFSVAGEMGSVGSSIMVLDTGACSTVRCGVGNCAFGAYSFAGGGSSNCTNSAYSVIVGGKINSTSAGGSFIGAGHQNQTLDLNSGIVSGGYNTIGYNSRYGFIGAGGNNYNDGYYSSILGGLYNTINNTGRYSSILSGCHNTVSACFSSASGAYLNACVPYTFYSNNFCACGSVYSSALTASCAVCVGTNGQLVGYTPPALPTPSIIVLDSGVCSTVRCGVDNCASGDYSFAGGGCCNTTNSSYSFIGGGGGNKILGGLNSQHSVIVGGNGNNINTSYNSIIGTGSLNNICCGGYSVIGGGVCNNLCNGDCSFIGGGNGNNSTSLSSFIGGGNGNNILGGVNSQNSAIVAGSGNTINCSYNSIINIGALNSICCNGYSVIGSGICNKLCKGFLSFIGGGCLNTSSSFYSFIGGGLCNTVSANFSGAVGCCLNACVTKTFYVNNFCACGSLYSSALATSCAVCVGANGQLVGYTLTNPITGTGTANYVPKFTGTNTIGNSLIYDNATSVGINTTSPNASYVLDINGSTKVAQNLLVGAGIYSSSVAYISTRQAKTVATNALVLASQETATPFPTDLIFKTEGATVGWSIQSTNQGVSRTAISLNPSGGSVGIGTTAPSTTFEVVGTGKFSGNLTTNVTANSMVKANASGILVAAVAGTDYQAPLTNPITGVGTTNYHAKFIGANALGNSLVYDNGSGVGINTTVINDMLSVNGSVLFILPAVGTNSYFQIKSGTATTFNTYIGTTAANQYAWFTNIKYNGSAFVKDDATRGAWRMNQVANTTDATSSFNLDYWNTAGSSSTLLTVLGTGNVGIGTISPSAKLHVVGGGITTGIANAATTLNTRFDLANPSISLGVGYVSADIPIIQSVNNNTNAATNLSINPFGGGVGIGLGTTSPTQILSVNSPFSVAGTLYPIAVSQQTSVEIGGIYSIAEAITNPIAAGLAFKTYQQNVGLVEKMRITNAGNVGIGTTSPTAKLDMVVANSATDIFTINASNNTNASLELYLKTDVTTLNAGGTGNFVFSNGNKVERMRISSGGNVGIGVTPSAWFSSYRALDLGDNFALLGNAGASDLYSNLYLNASSQFIYKTNGAASAYSMSTGAHRWYTVPSGTAGNVATLTQAMTLTNDGKLGIGTTAPSQTLDVVGNATFKISGTTINALNPTSWTGVFSIRRTDGTVGTAIGYNGATGDTYFQGQGNNTYYNLLLNPLGGNVGIGSSAPSGVLMVVGRAGLWTTKVISDTTTSLAYGLLVNAGTNTNDYSLFVTSAANANYLYIRGDGYAWVNTAAWAYGSDRRLKENISYIQESGVDIINKLKPAKFDYISGLKNNIGWIAQDVKEVIPEAVSVGDEKTGMLSLKSDFIVPYLVKAVQELKNEIEILKNK